MMKHFMQATSITWNLTWREELTATTCMVYATTWLSIVLVTFSCQLAPMAKGLANTHHLANQGWYDMIWCMMYDIWSFILATHYGVAVLFNHCTAWSAVSDMASSIKQGTWISGGKRVIPIASAFMSHTLWSTKSFQATCQALLKSRFQAPSMNVEHTERRAWGASNEKVLRWQKHDRMPGHHVWAWADCKMRCCHGNDTWSPLHQQVGCNADHVVGNVRPENRKSNPGTEIYFKMWMWIE